MTKLFPYRVAIAYYTGTKGNNIQFIWKIPEEATSDELCNKTTKITKDLEGKLPVYHTRAMKKAIEKQIKLVAKIKPAIMREMYRLFTGDASASVNKEQEKIDARVKLLFNVGVEDQPEAWDLRTHHTKQPEKFMVFWEECRKFLRSDIGKAPDDRRHHQVVHLARAISVRDLVEQVTKRCPPETPIPTIQWVRLQFWPKIPSAKTALQYTGRLEVRSMVLARQFRLGHVDAHYAAALFRYLKEMAVKFRQYAMLVYMDDKHRCKVGEPGIPVAAVERGRSVIVGRGESFEVSDHDFTKCSIIPSVIMIADIPEKIDHSWYRGRVLVGLKDAIFEASSPIRHMSELNYLLMTEMIQKPIALLYTDGGPDHRLTYVAVQISLICLFLSNNFDILIAVRTAPYHSWKNPVERIMSLLNLGLQSIGLMREVMPEEFEALLSNCGSMSDIRKKAELNPGLKNKLLESLKPVKDLMSSVFNRLELKGQAFGKYESASQAHMDELWSLITSKVDATLSPTETTKKANAQKQDFQNFLNTHCRIRHYMFSIKKCGQAECRVCQPRRLPEHIFSELDHLPDPMLESSEKYKDFADVYGTVTTEEFRPSLGAAGVQGNSEPKEAKNKKTGMPFGPNAQTASNARCLMECSECGRPRLVFSRYRLTDGELLVFLRLKEETLFTCGTALQELLPPEEEPELLREGGKDVSDEREVNHIVTNGGSATNHDDEDVQGLDDDTGNLCGNSASNGDRDIVTGVPAPVVLSLAAVLKKVFVNKKTTCATNMEVPYYSVKGYPPVCFYCGQGDDLAEVVEGSQPICESCKDKNKPVIKKRKRNIVSEKRNKRATTGADGGQGD